MTCKAEGRFEAAPHSGEASQWEYLESKRPHSHDVRALAVATAYQQGPVLISGGNDARLFAYRMAKFTKVLLSSCCEHPNISYISTLVDHFESSSHPLHTSLRPDCRSLSNLAQ